MSEDTSSTPTPSPAPPPPPPSPQPSPGATVPREVRIYSHSMLFYWWPLWAVGFLMGLLTLFGGQRMVLVPGKAKADRTLSVVTGQEMIGGVAQPKIEQREGILLPAGEQLLSSREDPNEPAQPRLHMSARSSFGIIWGVTLLVVIVITNVPLRGLWSVIVIGTIVLVSLVFALAGWWETIFTYFSLLDIRINQGGYFFISGVLLVMWIVTTFFFDRQIYMVFTPGQAKVCQEIGGGETAFDTIGMSIEKHRDDLFRHWILGLGSGDLTVKTSGANPQEFHMHNVLFVGQKLKYIERMGQRSGSVNL